MATKKKSAKKKGVSKKKAKPRGKPKTKQGLTQKQEELAQAYILHHGNQSDAYRALHPNSKSTTKSIWELSARAFNNVKVQSRIKELQELSTQNHLVTVETISQELYESFNMAKKLKQPANMTGSSSVKAKLHGLMIDQTKHLGAINLTGLSDQELQDIIDAISS